VPIRGNLGKEKRAKKKLRVAKDLLMSHI
jgi:hypothetical protein